MKKLKILCFHGYKQNVEDFRIKSGGFRKPLKKFCDFDFLQAPFEIENNLYGWFNVNEDFTEYFNLEKSISITMDYIKKNGPYDGFLSFSQGSLFFKIPKVFYFFFNFQKNKIFKGALFSLFIINSLKNIDLKFLILVSPPFCLSNDIEKLEKIKINTLMICGLNVTFINSKFKG
jgi:hypothetical protein